MDKFKNKEHVSEYRKSKRKEDDYFQMIERLARARAYRKRKAQEEACPKLQAERRAKRAAYMRKWYKKNKKKITDGRASKKSKDSSETKRA